MKAVILNTYLGKNPSRDEIDNREETKAVKKALESLGFEVFAVPFYPEIQKVIKNLKKIKPLFVFNIVESVRGNDSLAYHAPEMLDSLQIPYTGNHTKAMYNTTSKIETKKILKKNKILTPEWLPLVELASKKKFAKKKIIVKPSCEHASEDINDSSVFLAGNRDKLNLALKRKNPDKYFAEEFIEGREFNISLIEDSRGIHVLSPAEMTFVNFPKGKPKIVSYKAKWDEKSFESKNTIRKFNFEKKDKKLIDSLKKISEKTWNLFGLSGYARIDFRVDKKGKPYVLEINSNPCISPDSGFVAACKKERITYKQVISKLIERIYKK